MNLFEKHMKKKALKEGSGTEVRGVGASGDVPESEGGSRDEGSELSGGIDLNDSQAQVKRLAESTDVSFFVGRSSDEKEQGGDPETISDPVPSNLEYSTVKEVHLDYRDGHEVFVTRQNLGKLPTGVSQIDAVLDGGLEPSCITEVYGGFSSGKTQFCFQVTARCLSAGSKVLFLDTESTFRPTRILDILGSVSPEILRRVICVQARSTEEQLHFPSIAEKEFDLSEFGLVIVDSLTALFRAEFTDRGGISVRQHLINRHLRDLLNLAIKYQLPVLVTNQITTRIDGGGSRDIAAGGNIVAHGTTHRLEFKVIEGGLRRVLVRDSPNLPESSCTFRITSTGLM